MSRPAPALLLVAVLAIPGAARADDYSLHVLGNVQTSWTDNLFATPAATAESDLNTQIRPGLLLAYETPRTVHQLSYDLEANLYAKNTEAWSVNHLASWHGFFMTSPRTETQTSASYARGTMNSLTPSTVAQEGGNGANHFWSIEGGESLSFTMTRELRLTQGMRARRFSQSDEDSGVSSGGTEVGLNGGIDRGWARNALAFQLSGAFVMLDAGPTTTDSINGNAQLSFRRDLSQRWTALVDGGLAAVIPIDGQVFVQPTIGTNIGYVPNWGAAGLQLRRAMQPNFYIARNTITDSATINASLPLPWLAEDINRPKLTAAGAMGVSRTRQIVDGAVDGAVDVASFDVSLQYNPRPGFGLALRGSHQRQIVEDVGSMGAATVNDYHRTTIMLSANFRFPDRVAAEIPIRDSLRVDRSDNTPVGGEGATPAP